MIKSRQARKRLLFFVFSPSGTGCRGVRRFVVLRFLTAFGPFVGGSRLVILQIARLKVSSVKLRQTRLNRKSVKCKIKADLPQFGKCQIKVSSVKLRQVCPNSESVKDWKKVSKIGKKCQAQSIFFPEARNSLTYLTLFCVKDLTHNVSNVIHF